MNPLSFIEVSKSFDGVHALSAVTASLTAGRIVGLIGDNGAGKTTFIRLATGILRPSNGEVRLLGRVADRNEPELMTRVGALIETPGHYEELTAAENLRFAFAFYHRRAPQGTVEGVVRSQLRSFGLEAVADTPVGRLSSGFRQRLAVARAAHPWADVVLLDEPFVNLDPVVRIGIKQQLRELKAAGKLVVFSSHTLSDVEQLTDEILLLVAGRLYRFEDFAAIRRLVGKAAEDDPDAVYAALHQAMSAREDT
ncbi:MAG TPA: ABC transporter ATP-binding protein [Gemmatimonadales bacterium]|nr:ABC transporter ATP-binding protein [Gemmatimonadales bacterium]